LQEFRKSFDHFDKDHTNTLEKHELKACLSSLGQELTDDELDALIARIDKHGEGRIEFDDFCDYMIKKLADQDSPDQVKEAFRLIAGSKDFLTENDLTTVLQFEDAQFLIKIMPKNENGYDYQSYTNTVYGI